MIPGEGDTKPCQIVENVTSVPKNYELRKAIPVLDSQSDFDNSNSCHAYSRLGLSPSALELPFLLINQGRWRDYTDCAFDPTSFPRLSIAPFCDQVYSRSDLLP